MDELEDTLQNPTSSKMFSGLLCNETFRLLVGAQPEELKLNPTLRLPP